MAADLFSAFSADSSSFVARSDKLSSLLSWTSFVPSDSFSSPSSGPFRPPPVVLHRSLDSLPNLRHIRHDGALVFAPFAAFQYSTDVHSTGYVCVAWNRHGALISRQVNVRAGISKLHQFLCFFLNFFSWKSSSLLFLLKFIWQFILHNQIHPSSTLYTVAFYALFHRPITIKSHA